MNLKVVNRLALYAGIQFFQSVLKSSVVVHVTAKLMDNSEQPIGIHWFLWVVVLAGAILDTMITLRAFIDNSVSEYADKENTEPEST